MAHVNQKAAAKAQADKTGQGAWTFEQAMQGVKRAAELAAWSTTRMGQAVQGGLCQGASRLRWQLPCSQWLHVLVQHIGVRADKEDEDFLKQVENDPTGDLLNRAFAAFVRGLIAVDSGDRDFAAQRYRAAIRFADELKAQSKAERTRAVMFELGMKPVTEVLETFMGDVRDNLSTLRTGPVQLRQQKKRGLIEYAEEIYDQAYKLRGEKCDHCGENGTLARCSVCKRLWYCSKTCQKKAWDAGHRHCCRQTKDLREGDLVRLNRGDGRVAEVLEKLPTGTQEDPEFRVKVHFKVLADPEPSQEASFKASRMVLAVPKEERSPDPRKQSSGAAATQQGTAGAKKQSPEAKLAELRAELEKLMEAPGTSVEKLAELEREVVKAYIAVNPYPPLEEVRRRIQNAGLPPSMKRPMFEEYEQGRHKLCKTIYDSGFSDAVTREVGELLAQQSGIEGMRRSYYTLMHASPTADAPDMPVRYAVSVVQHAWNGITDGHGDTWLA